MNYKDCQEWKRVGFPLSTTSNEAAKMYDAVLTQYMTGYGDDSLGGIGPCFEKMLTADPGFVLGHAAKNGLTLISGGGSILSDKELKNNIDKMVEMAQNTDITPLEKLHVDAVKLWSVGKTAAACDKWEEVLLHFPTDILALRNHFITDFYFGRVAQYTDCMARILPYWKSYPSLELYSDMRSMYAFGLEESNLFEEAEKLSREALLDTPRDGWGIHTVAHVMETQGRIDEGISFIQDKENDFQNHVFHGHLYWHLGLHYIEKGDYEAAMTLYDDKLCKRMESGMTIDLTDTSSFLYRLQLEGVNVGDRWNKVYEHWAPYAENHSYAFDDIHNFMSAQGAKQSDCADKFIQSIKEFVSIADDDNMNAQVFKHVGIPLCEAFEAYGNGDYAKAVDIMTPIRYKVIEIGGSHAQADIFNLFLIHAALKSPEERHKLLARSFLYERRAQRKCSPMTTRLLGQIASVD